MTMKIIYDRNCCIGAGACESAMPSTFSINSDGKADLDKGIEVSQGLFELEIDESERAVLENAIISCPVAAIRKKD